MKKYNFSFLIVMFIGVCQAQSNHEVTYGDLRYMKQKNNSYSFDYVLKDTLSDGNWVVYEKKDDEPWKKKKDLYDNPKYRGNKKIICEYKNGVKNGEQIELFYNQDVHKIVAEYKNGVIDGKNTWWFNDSTKEMEGYFNEGKQVGQWLSWYQDGKLSSDYLYKDGKLIKWTKWFQNGQKWQQGFGDYCFRRDVLIKWYKNGKVEYTANYDEGRLLNWSKYYETGQISSSGFGGIMEDDISLEYSFGKCKDNSKKEGVWQYFSEQGKIVKEEIYKEDKLLDTKEFK